MSQPTPASAPAALSKELSDFLIEFSIGLHKHAIYPPGHPLLAATTTELARRLEVLLRTRPALSLGVARHQLIIEGVATDGKNPVLRDLATRLHRHQLGAVKFSAGVHEDEISDLLATVAVDVGRLPRPLGLEGPEVLAQWPHARLFPMTFAQLQLIEEGPEPPSAEPEDQIKGSGAANRPAALWIGLARAALANESGVRIDPDDAASVDPTVVAQAIEERKRDAAYDQVVVGYLLQIAEELKAKGGRDEAALQRRVSSLVSTLSTDTLQRLLEMSGDVRQRRRFVLDASQGMAVDAVVELVKAAADTSGQTISHSMLRMLSKLAVHAEAGAQGVRTQADGALRDQVARLVAGWELEDPSPDGYRRALERMATSAPLFLNNEARHPVEPERLLAIGLEIGTLGDQVWRSADALASGPDLSSLLDLLEAAPEAWSRDALWRHVATPQQLRLQLALDPPPYAQIARLVARMGASAADPLLDALEEVSDERAVERLVALLEQAGGATAPAVLARLPGLRWTLVRPLIALLGKHREWECGYSAAAFLGHPDAGVRREALRQLLRERETRDLAIVRALGDADERTVRLALGAAMTDCPRDAAALLRVRADDGTLPPELRALGVRALAAYRAPQTPAWLAQRVVRTGRLIKRPTLAPKSPEMLAALEGLATHWRTDRAAQEALALAAESGDAEVRAAVRPREGGA